MFQVFLSLFQIISIYMYIYIYTYILFILELINSSVIQCILTKQKNRQIDKHASIRERERKRINQVYGQSVDIIIIIITQVENIIYVIIQRYKIYLLLFSLPFLFLFFFPFFSCNLVSTTVIFCQFSNFTQNSMPKSLVHSI